jgi:transcriptional regulator GlxA family with amidase domain
MPARRVVIVAFEDVQALDVTGPAEVFSMAARPPGAYRVELATPGGRSVRTSSGLRLDAHCDLYALSGAVDTVVVAGGPGTRLVERDEAFVRSVRALAGRARRVASVCSGALLLASAGLLDGRRATTHWDALDELERRYPSVTVERDPIFVRDGTVATSAGVTAGMDLALTFVEEDLGAEAALHVARLLVLFVRRPGGQSQFSTQLTVQPARQSSLRALQEWIPGHLDEDLSVPALAARAFMSERNFARAFRRETGLTPGAYVEAMRVERARTELGSGSLPVDAVARYCGFGSVDAMRRAFRRRLGVSPAAYRSRFQSVPDASQAA